MSIYSGFATRHQEQTYDHLLFDLIDVLQRRIIKFYTAEQADEHKFHTILTNLYRHLAKMEDSKYLEPKFAPTFKQLLAVTSTVNQTYLDLKQQLNAEAESHQPLPGKDSLSFSRDKRSQDLKGVEIGKIRHQFHIKEDFSSRKDSNPEDNPPFESKVPRAQSTHFHKNFRSRKQFQKKGCHHESYFKQNFKQGTQPEQIDKKNMSYKIREYVRKGLHKQSKRKSYFE